MPTPDQPPSYSIPDLLHLSHTSKILFRIHDPTSSTPLFWTGNRSTSGFSAPNLNLGILTPEAYSQVYNRFNPALITDKTEYEGWAGGKYIRHTILDHVMGKEKQSCLPTLTSMDERPDTPQDEMTPWISASADLLWCMYEIVRRLVSLEKKSVYLTVIRHPDTVSPSTKTTRSTEEGVVEESSSNRSNSSSGCRELLVDPYPLLRINHIKAKDLVLSVGMRENYEISARATRHSSERLFWGRIFSESILYNVEFTMTVNPSFPQIYACVDDQYTPLELPGQFYESDRKVKKGKGRSWIDGLVWDPKEDAFDTAYRKILDRAKEIAILAGEAFVS
jgi:hypothetical protein